MSKATESGESIPPKLRQLEAVHYRDDGQDMFLLRDPVRLSERELHVSPDVFAVASLLDGKRTVAGIREEVHSRYGAGASPEAIGKVIDALEEAHFLESPEFDKWRKGIKDEFRKLRVRPSILAGSSYPEDRRDIPKLLDGFFARKGGPGRPDKPTEGAAPPRGVISPHIDLRRGGKAIAHAYRPLAEAARPDTVVVLGVAHAGAGEFFTLTRKDFETPLGRVRTDKELVERLAGAAGDCAFSDEYAHKGEHSIEIQLPWLQHIWKGDCPKIVPVLCGSLAPCLEEGVSPRDVESLSNFAAELGRIMNERAGKIVVIASADLAHIGRRFGDDVPITPRLLRKNEECDRAMLEFVASGDADGFFEYVRAEEDRRKVCGLAAIYVLLTALEGAGGVSRGRLLHYEQSHETETESLVSYAAMALE